MRATPQLSVPVTEPQFLPRRVQKAALVSGVPEPPPQTLGVPPPPQVAGAVQVPHELTMREAPQLSAAVTLPQFLPRREQKVVFDSGVQPPPPPQVASLTTTFPA